MAVSSSTSATTGTNIDVNSIVSQLMAIEQRPITALTTKETSAQSKISAFGQVKSSVSTFQTSLQALSSPYKFQANSATSSDTSVFTATAATSASVGSHTLDVLNLAQNQRLATAGVASNATAIGTGTLTFDFGTISGGVFNTTTGKYGATELSNATVANSTTAATVGTTFSTASFIPDATTSGTIPAGTFTINGVSVGEITLHGVDTAVNMAAAFDAAYVTSGGTLGTFSGIAGGAVSKATDGINSATFGIAGTATDADAAAAKLSELMTQTGLSAAQLGTQAYNKATVTVASTSTLTVGDTISGGGFPAGTTIASIVDATHFLTTKPGTNASGVTLSVGSASSTTTFTPNTTTAKTVTIDSSNNTLQGIRDAINTAQIGVTASIVNDGTSAPYRLVLNSDTIGVSNSMKISVSGDAALSSLLSNDPTGTQNLSEIVSAKNASLVVDGLAVSKATNTINDVFQGVTLNLLKPTTTTATLNVSRDTATVQTSIESFVKSYNDLNKVITDLTAFNPTTKKGAVLQGDSALRSLKSQIDGILSTSVSTAAGSFTTLSQIGVSKQTNGNLAIDSTKLASAMTNNFSDIAGLFAAVGKPSDSLVSYKTVSSATLPGNYAVSVSTLATQGNLLGAVDLTSATTVIDADTTVSATVDGTAATVALTAGSYSGSELASMIQSAINGTSAFSSTGKSVVAALNSSGFLSFNSNSFGSSSGVSLTSNTGTFATNFLGAANATAGIDVAGTINGLAATGSGQTLTSSTGDSTGLQIQINGGATGARGTVNYSQGYAHKLNEFANTSLGSTGLLTGRLDGLSASVKSISQQKDVINARLVTIEARYRRQYTKLDAMLSNFNKTSSYLTQQLSKM